MKTIDVLHRQLVHLNVLFVEQIKQGIEVKNESKPEKQARAKFLLHQAISVLNWINEFDPQNVNTKDLYLPPHLMDLYNYSSTVVKKLPDFLNETVEHRLK